MPDDVEKSRMASRVVAREYVLCGPRGSIAVLFQTERKVWTWLGSMVPPVYYWENIKNTRIKSVWVIRNGINFFVESV